MVASVVSHPDDGDPAFDLLGVSDIEEPECQISGCDRPGAVPRNVRGDDPEEPIAKHYVCRYHHRLFLGVKVVLGVSLVVLFLVVFFNL